ncbi:MAG: helix-turn-helix domain-containing protein [Spirochaetota bacterium]
MVQGERVGYLPAARTARGPGQRELAKLVGVSRQWIVEIEHGKFRAEVGLVLQTLRALGLELSVTKPAPDPVRSSPDSPDLDALISRTRERR